MILFKTDINTFDDIKDEYPSVKDVEELRYKRSVRILIDKSYKKLHAEERKHVKRVTAKRNIELHELAEVKGLYWFLWSVDHLTEQANKYGWRPKDIPVLINSMEAKHFNPYSTTEDTASKYIESLGDFGYTQRTVKRIRFIAFNPTGKK